MKSKTLPKPPEEMKSFLQPIADYIYAVMHETGILDEHDHIVITIERDIEVCDTEVGDSNG